MTDTNPTEDLVAALAALTDPRKDGRVEAGQRRYRYLELPDLLAEIRRVFGEHRWAVMQQITTEPGTITVTNIWLHSSGEQLTHPPFAMPCGRSPQEIGSAITYARRYSLAGLAGLSGSDDDDAQTAQPHPGPRSTSPDRHDTRQTTVQVRPPAPPQDLPPAQVPLRAVDPKPELVTPAQLSKINAMLGDWERHENRKLDRDERRRLIGFMAGIPNPDTLASAKELTRTQASDAIEKLQQALDTQTVDVPPQVEP